MRFAKCKSMEGIKDSGRSVAIIGAGPAGLRAAGILRCSGHRVEVYDMMPEPGGLMVFGIPDYHVPTKGVRDGVKELVELGVIFHNNMRVHSDPNKGDITLEEIISNHDATLIATGTWDSRRLNVPGENLERVYIALDWLVDYYLVEKGYKKEETLPPLGKVGLVIGGGLTAVDAAEVPLKYVKEKFGIEKVYLSYRRSRKEAPMGEKEFKRLEEELGIKTLEQTIPLEFKGNGSVKKVVLQRTKLVPVEKGRPKPVPIEGSEFELDIDYVMVAAGEIPTPPFEDECCGIKVEKWKAIKTDKKYRTTRKGVFAAGDVKHGASLIGPAFKSGNDAAKYIEEFLATGEWGWED